MLNPSIQCPDPAGETDEQSIGAADVAAARTTEVELQPAAQTGDDSISPVCAARWAY
ncbi:MAG: hypothetical protein AB7S71_10680 [Dongiaceae bacterium]